MHSLCQRGYAKQKAAKTNYTWWVPIRMIILYIGMRSAFNLKRKDLVGFRSRENQNSLQKQVFAILFCPVMWWCNQLHDNKISLWENQRNVKEQAYRSICVKSSVDDLWPWHYVECNKSHMEKVNRTLRIYFLKNDVMIKSWNIISPRLYRFLNYSVKSTIKLKEVVLHSILVQYLIFCRKLLNIK